MASRTAALASIIVGLAAQAQVSIAAPTQVLAIRDTITISIPTSLSPVIVDHGVLDAAGLSSMVASATSADFTSETLIPGAFPTPVKVRRQAATTTSISLTTSTNGPFLAVDGGVPATGCTPFTINGPIQTLEAILGSSDMRGFIVTDSSSNTTNVTGLAGTSAGQFAFNSNERIKEFNVFVSDVQFLGFNFTTDAGRSYNALTSIGQLNIATNPAVSVNVGSGIISRIRGGLCTNGIMANVGFDFLDNLSSIGISNISYSGFTNNIAPSGPGTTLSVGSEILDNRNSSVQQTISIQTIDAVTTQHSVTVSKNWQVGNSISIESGANIPFLVSGKVSTEVNWQISGSTDTQDLTSETLTKSATVNLACPAGKFCVGNAIFSIFKLDVDIEATFQAKTTSGQSFTWVQSGSYNSAGSLALKLTVDEASSPITT